MIFKHLLIFINMNMQQIKRKWLSLPLLLLSPIIIVSLIAALMISFFTIAEDSPIQVGLVDLDQSTETTMLTELLTEATELGTYVQIHNMSEKEAQLQIEENHLSAYIIFPKRFTDNLYAGNAVKLKIKGNPSQPTESLAIKELLDSLARHIRSAQANILTINEYARQLPIDQSTRQDLLFEQFTDFFLYTIGKDKIINQKKIENIATASPLHYFLISAWFILITIWVFLLNTTLYQAHSLAMQKRMILYGVKITHQVLARIIVAFFIAASLAIGSFLILEHLVDFQLSFQNKLRVSFLIILYSLLFLVVYTLIEAFIHSEKIQLFMQLLFTVMFLLSSGAIIPSLYFSLHIQDWIAHTFSYEALYWIQQITLNGRFYANYLPLLKMNLVGFLLLISILTIKDRVQH